MEFHVLMLLLMVICGYAEISLAGQVLPPRITPFGEDFVTVPKTSHKLTNASHTYRLLCEGQKPVNWRFPEPFLYNFHPSIKNLSVWNQESNIDYPYAAQIVVEDASYDDTGYYYCSYTAPTVPISQLEPDATSSIYVFVRDKSHLLVGSTGHNTYQAIQYRSVVFDCRPTSPEVEVSLWLDDMRIDAGTNTAESKGMKVTFDPTVGFTLENVSMNNHDNQYECKGERGDDTDDFTIDLSVFAHRDSMAKPRITGGSIVAVGGELILNCSVMVDDGVYFSMNWTVPDPTAIIKEPVSEGRIQIDNSTLAYVTDPNGMKKRVGSKVLRILQALRTDLGNYTCNVRDHAGNENTATKYINIIS